MSKMILHCGSEESTLEQVKQVPVPPHTSTWRPVPYGQAIEWVRLTVQDRIGARIETERFGLNREGNQLFGLMTLDTGDAEHALSIGIRGSYDKSLAWGVAIGSNVFVCDNLCFSSNAFLVMRKNTVNVWQDYTRMVYRALGTARQSHDAMRTDITAMKALPCSVDDGYAVLGRMFGHGLLTPRQASVAFGDWREPRHEDFTDRNVWSLYNCATEGLKKGPRGQIIDRHCAAHEFFRQAMADARPVA